LTHARLAARHLHIDDLPLLVTPHPVNDLTPEQVQDMARAAYPVIVKQLTSQGEGEQNTLIDYVHPATRLRAARVGADSRGSTP
jgi:hypothetical protein